MPAQKNRLEMSRIESEFREELSILAATKYYPKTVIVISSSEDISAWQARALNGSLSNAVVAGNFVKLLTLLLTTMLLLLLLPKAVVQFHIENL